MKKVKIKFNQMQTAFLKVMLEEAGKGEHDMGTMVMNIVMLELAQKLLPKLIFATESSFSLTNSEAFVLSELLYDDFNKTSMNSMMARAIVDKMKPVYGLLTMYNLTTNA